LCCVHDMWGGSNSFSFEVKFVNLGSDPSLFEMETASEPDGGSVCSVACWVLSVCLVFSVCSVQLRTFVCVSGSVLGFEVTGVSVWGM